MILDGLSGIVYLFSGKFSFVMAIFKAHLHFYTNLKSLKEKRKLLLKNITNQNHTEIHQKSIVFDYFIRKKKTFKQLNIITKK